MKKVAFVTFNNRVILDRHNIRSLEAIYCAKYLETFLEREVSFLTRVLAKDLKHEHGLRLIDISTVDTLNNFDEVIIHNHNANFFGGVINRADVKLMELLCKFHGAVYYYITDPKLNCYNYAQPIKDRSAKNKLTVNDNSYTADEVFGIAQGYNIVYLRMKALFTGVNFTKYQVKTGCDLSHWKTLPIFEFMFINELQDYKQAQLAFEEPKQYDVCYYGNNRGGSRAKRLKKYLDKCGLSTYIIGYKPDFEHTTFVDYVHHDKLYREVRKSIASLVIGDDEHNSNWVTARFFENIKAGIISLIDSDYDKDKQLYSSIELKNFCYISTQQDLVEKILTLKNNNELRLRLIELQYEELKKYSNLKLTQ